MSSLVIDDRRAAGRPLMPVPLVRVRADRAWRGLALRWFAGFAMLAAWSAWLYERRPAACFARATAAMDRGNAEGIQYEILPLLRQPAYEAHVSLLQGKLLALEQRWEGVPDAVELAFQHADTEGRALVMKGEALYWMGQLREAGETWTQLVELDPDNVDAHRWLGVAYYDLGATPQAIDHLETAAKLAPDDPRPHRMIGIAWQDVSRPAPAAVAYRESLRRDPNQEDVDDTRFRLGECLHLMRKDAEALKWLQQCPPLTPVLLARAQCEFALGHEARAAELLEQSLAKQPDHAPALILAAEMALRRQDTESAARSLEKAAKASPANVAVRYQLAAVYRRLGREEEAHVEKDRMDELKRLADEYQSLSIAAAKAPNDVEVRCRLGQLADRLDMPHFAKTWFRSALYLDPTSDEANRRLTALLEAQADSEP
jgi:tetratricopeptide (TPR) repeat protein